MTTLLDDLRPMLAVNGAIDLYLGDLTRSGRRDRTRATYSRYLIDFCEGLPIDTDVAKVTADDVRRYLDRYLHHSRGTQALIFSVLNGFFKWAVREEKIKRSPMERMSAPRRLSSESLDVTTVSTEDVRRIIGACRGWTEKLAVCIPVYMGCRRGAAAELRARDYNRENRTLRFQEKGGKTIWKPVPDGLR